MRFIFASGVASARKSSTPASRAMAAAVRGLSPVIITVRMPMARKRSKRSVMPPLTTSFSSTMPSTRPPSETASGVPPESPMRPDAASMSAGIVPPRVATWRATASTAPLRITRSPMSQPLMRVWAVKGTKVAFPASSRPRSAKRSLARTTMERPSGVSSARLASCAASARSSTRAPAAGMKSVAMRFPSVIVPVLSSRSTSTSPAASTARPLMASTFLRRSRSMPAMPMAERSPPMVVGMRQTSSATMAVTDSGIPE